MRLNLAFALTFAICGPTQTSPPGVQKKANVTYLAGSRHEGYDLSGMAHLLEHMNFIETFREHIGASAVTIVKAGDFYAAGVYL